MSLGASDQVVRGLIVFGMDFFWVRSHGVCVEGFTRYLLRFHQVIIGEAFGQWGWM